jgi:hypothetical protein
MTKPKSYRTKTGRELTDDDIAALADEVESTTYDVDALKARRRGRPAMGTAPAEVVPVRLDPALRDAVEARARQEHTTTSEVIRRALRDFLDVA